MQKITLHLFDETYIALRGCYEHKETLKTIASQPDLLWSAEAGAWLLDVALMDRLYLYLGDYIAPASVAFWCECPLPTQATYRRRTKQQIMAQKRKDAEAAGHFGRLLVEAMHKER